MKKKFYGVRAGRKTGLFTSWDDCKAAVHGFAGAVYKGFLTKEEALEYLEGGAAADEVEDPGGLGELPATYAFVDGSYNIRTKTYGYGGFLIHDGKRHVISGSGNDPEMASMRNVAGEIGGCVAALKKSIELGIDEVTVYYDYAGIENWALGYWKTNKKGTKEYKSFYDSVKDRVNVKFVKVRGHAGIPGNEEADAIAKKAAGL